MHADIGMWGITAFLLVALIGRGSQGSDSINLWLEFSSYTLMAVRRSHSAIPWNNRMPLGSLKRRQAPSRYKVHGTPVSLDRKIGFYAPDIA